MTKLNDLAKRHKKTVIVLFFIGLFWVIWHAIPLSKHFITANNSIYNRHMFSLANYDLHDKQLGEDLKILIPQGTPEKQVDELLVDIGDASKEIDALTFKSGNNTFRQYPDLRVSKIARYSYKMRVLPIAEPNPQIRIVALYDSNDELLELYTYGNGYLYHTGIHYITIKELKGEEK